MKLNNIKLAGIDLDGTLFNSEKKIDGRTRHAIKSAYSKGIQIIPVTGRPFSGLSEEIMNINEISYAITNNGAEIYNLKTKKPIFSRQINNQDSLSIIKESERINTVFEVFTNGFGYLTEETLNHYISIHGNSPVGEYIKTSRKTVDNIYSFMQKHNYAADEIFISIPNIKTKNQLESTLNKFRNIQYWSIFDKFIEVTHKNADKGKAFSFLADYLNVDIKNTIALGDGENDISLLKCAGVSVAMANAEESVKNIADIITSSNDNYGAAEIIEQL